VALSGFGHPSVITSPDGIIWTPGTDLYEHYGKFTGWWTSIAFGDGVFVAIATKKTAAFSPDGITWKEIGRPSWNVMTSIAYGNGVFAAVGYGTSSSIRLGTTTSATKDPDPKARLKELKDLFDSGMITEKEYNDKKAEILSQL
jgi:hypothetical protein